MSIISERNPILALRYEGAPPAPHPPCTCPTPDDIAARECEIRARRALEQSAVDAERREAPSVVAQIGGLLSTAAHAVSNVVQSSKDQQASEYREWEHKQGEEKFAMNFPDLAEAGERFIVQYSACVMSRGECMPGHVLLTENYIAFVSETIKDIFPLRDILSIQRSIRCKTANGRPPLFLPVPQHFVIPDCIQLFMRDHKVLQFMDIQCPPSTSAEEAANAAAAADSETTKCLPIDRFFNWVDHAWRKVVQVPVPGVNYAHIYTQQYSHIDARHEVYCDPRTNAHCVVSALQRPGVPPCFAHFDTTSGVSASTTTAAPALAAGLGSGIAGAAKAAPMTMPEPRTVAEAHAELANR